MPLKILVTLVLAALVVLAARSVRAEEFTLRLESVPAAEKLTPQGEVATLALTVTASGGQPAADGWIVVQLEAPRRGFFSTDFPLVEGSRLLQMRVPLIDGKAEWLQMLPIRGEYRLSAEFSGAAGARSEKVFTLHVAENQHKWLLLGAFTLGLFCIGVIAGRVFTRTGGTATTKLGSGLTTLLICFAVIAESAWAQDGYKRKYLSKIEVAPATVGTAARIHWWLHPAGVNGKTSAKLTLTITHLEKNRLVFSLEKIPVAGEFVLEYQFTDGTDHQVIAQAETEDGETVRQEQTVSVTAVAPALATKLVPLFLFLTVVAAGLLAGRWSRKALGSTIRTAQRPRFQA